MKTIELNKETFDATLGGGQPVLVDFWADWCGPCKMIGPVVEQLATEYEGRAVVAKVDVDEEPELARRFGIRAIPTLILFKDGQPLKTFRGMQEKAELIAAIELAG